MKSEPYEVLKNSIMNSDFWETPRPSEYNAQYVMGRKKDTPQRLVCDFAERPYAQCE